MLKVRFGQPPSSLFGLSGRQYGPFDRFDETSGLPVIRSVHSLPASPKTSEDVSMLTSR